MTDIEIVNAALVNLGCDTINAFDDLSAEARVAKAKYAICRDDLLVSVQWTFNTVRRELAESATPPVFGYAHAYALPNDALSVIRCFDGGGDEILDFNREGDFVVTDTEAPVYAIVQVRVPEGAFYPKFTKALEAQLSADMAVGLTENRALADSWEAKAEARLAKAAAVEGRQGTSETIKPPRLPGRVR